MGKISEEKIRECVHLFMSTDRKRRKYCDSFVKDLGIHNTQHRILMYLAHKGCKVSQIEIAERFEVSPAAIAVTIKKLVQAGFIKKTTSKNDSRFNDISLTDKGQVLVNETGKRFSQVDEKMFRYMNEEETDNMIIYLKKIQKAMNEENDEESEQI